MMMYKHSMEDPPSGGAPKQAPRWDLTRTEGYGGGTRVFSIVLMVSGYVDMYRKKEGTGGLTWDPRGRGHALGGAPPTLVGTTWTLLRGSQVSRAYFAPKISLPKVSFRLDSV